MDWISNYKLWSSCYHWVSKSECSLASQGSYFDIFLDELWAFWDIMEQFLVTDSLCPHTYCTTLLTQAFHSASNKDNVSSNLLFWMVCLVFVLLCDVILGLSSESEQSVTTDNDDLNVGAQSNTKISCVGCSVTNITQSSNNSPSISERLFFWFHVLFECSCIGCGTVLVILL